MRKELEYFRIENAYGGSQDWFGDPMMKLGGCWGSYGLRLLHLF